VSGVDYLAMMQAVRAKLAAVAPTRIVTRKYAMLDEARETDLNAGIYLVVSSGVSRYPWDWTDSADAAPDGPPATAMPVFVFRVLGRQLLAESADGEDVEAAEFAMLAEIEELAAELVRDESMAEHEQLCRAVLKGIDMSNQLETPYAWVAAMFALEVN
jgi:hypothetical protein